MVNSKAHNSFCFFCISNLKVGNAKQFCHPTCDGPQSVFSAKRHALVQIWLAALNIAQHHTRASAQEAKTGNQLFDFRFPSVIHAFARQLKRALEIPAQETQASGVAQIPGMAHRITQPECQGFGATIGERFVSAT